MATAKERGLCRLRWSSRLSLGITDRLTARLAARYPRALVTDRPLTETPSDRLLINIGRLDVTAAGVATLDADFDNIVAALTFAGAAPEARIQLANDMKRYWLHRGLLQVGMQLTLDALSTAGNMPTTAGGAARSASRTGLLFCI